MKLIAGHKGLDNLVKWVHIVEDPAVTSFLRGYELIFTAGYMVGDTQKLLQFIMNLYEMQASAFILNIGPYIKSVPAEVLEFCNQVNLPLFTIPWETRMVDMTRDFCTRIIRNENAEASIVTTIKDIIFNVGDLETQICQMERYGYKRDSSFCFLNISLNHVQKHYESENVEKLKLHVERIARRNQRLLISFRYQSNLVIVLSENKMEQVSKFVEDLLDLLEREKNNFSVNIGVSLIVQGFVNQGSNFERAVTANKMAKKKNISVDYYEDLDLYKILLAVQDKTILQEFYQDVFGKLEQYDQENNTDLMGFLHAYLEHDGKPQLVAEQQFIHRNTVNNQIKKIEKITGYNLMNLNEKVRCSIAYLIKDIL
jgi:hypothetical protein